MIAELTVMGCADQNPLTDTNELVHAGPYAPGKSNGSITGANGTAICAKCHNSVQGASFTLSGPTVVSPGTTHQYTATITGGPAVVGGLDVAVNGGALIAGTGTHLQNGEVTHNDGKAFSGGSVSWNFEWTAPSTPGSIAMFGAGVSADNDGGNKGDDGDVAATLTITVEAGNAPPVADANGPYTANVGEMITFDGSASSDSDGQIASYEWDFGDGSTGTGVKPTHAYAAAGNYDVTLTVTDDGGASDTDATTATITDVGGANYELKRIRVTHPRSAGQLVPVSVSYRNVGSAVGPATIVVFLDGVQQGPSIQVSDMPGNGPGTSSELRVIFPETGEYEVRVVLTDDFGPESLTETIRVR